MYRFAGYPFATWDGALQGPAGAGPRLSSARSVSVHASAVEAWSAAWTYRNLASPGGGYDLETPSGETLTPVRVVEARLAELVKRNDGWWVHIEWTLVWG